MRVNGLFSLDLALTTKLTRMGVVGALGRVLCCQIVGTAVMSPVILEHYTSLRDLVVVTQGQKFPRQSANQQPDIIDITSVGGGLSATGRATTFTVFAKNAQYVRGCVA